MLLVVIYFLIDLSNIGYSFHPALCKGQMNSMCANLCH